MSSERNGARRAIPSKFCISSPPARLDRAATTPNAPSPIKLSSLEPNVAAARPQPAASKTATALAPKAAANYQVKNGDTLWDIARRHKVTIAEIQKWNNLSDPSAVRPGSTLKIKKEK